MKSGYLLLSPEQRAEMDNLNERCTHQDVMRFTPLDAITLVEYEKHCTRLANEATADVIKVKGYDICCFNEYLKW